MVGYFLDFAIIDFHMVMKSAFTAFGVVSITMNTTHIYMQYMVTAQLGVGIQMTLTCIVAWHICPITLSLNIKQ